MGGYLDTGKTITVVFGDTSRGSPGWRMQTFCERSFELKTLVGPYATYVFREIEKSPAIRIVPGEPVRAVCIAPSVAEAGTPFTCRLRTEDRWGNITRKALTLTRRAVTEQPTIIVHATDKRTGLSADSNPIRVVAKVSGRGAFWADFHGQSEETIGTGTVDEYFSYARDRACVDIAGHQGNDFQITDDFWDQINRTTAAFNEPGRFVTFPGYEWSGNTPLGGDRNVFHATEGGPIYRSSLALVPRGSSRFPVAGTVSELLRRLVPGESFLFAHVGGRYADSARHRDGLELAFEIHSAWGTFEWFVEEALDKGYKVGICANSDGHKGRPGASYPGASRFGSYGGLTCLLAPSLTRAAILEALRKRHFFATTGNRPLLDVSLVDGSRSAMMGDVISVTEPPELRVHVVGTAPIDYAELKSGSRLIRRVTPYAAAQQGRRVKVTWSGAKVRGRDRMIRWDGSLRVENNQILGCTPINSWNPDHPMNLVDHTTLEWESATTGGTCGVIVDLEDPKSGRMSIESPWKSIAVDVGAVTLRGRRWKLGGLGKQIEIYRLAKIEEERREISFTQTLLGLLPGPNPIFVKVVQQDGHMAWSSPIFVTIKPQE